MSEMPSPAPRQVARAVELAAEMRERSYAPYSQFPMGAAIIGPNGEEIGGTLIENVSLGLAICSERVALFTSVTEQVQANVLAVCSKRTDGRLTFPCGACLQVALELAGDRLLVAAVDPDGEYEVRRLGQLLTAAPHRFTPAYTDLPEAAVDR